MYRLLILALAATALVGAQPDDSQNFHRPIFHPDGDTLIVMSDRADGDWELYRVGLDGSQPIRLTRHAGWDGYADVSPDGAQIVFDRRDEEHFGIAIADIDGGHVRWLVESEGGFLGGPKYAPDGRSIVYASEQDGNRELYRLWLDSGRRERLTYTDHDEGDAVFAPDGRSLAYTAWVDDEHSALEVLELNAGETRRLATVQGRMYGNSWGPDGSFLLYNDDSDGDQEIWRIAATGGRPQKLTDNEVLDHLAVVSADGSRAVYTSETEEVERVYMIDLESGRSRHLDLGW